MGEREMRGEGGDGLWGEAGSDVGVFNLVEGLVKVWGSSRGGGVAYPFCAVVEAFVVEEHAG
jgi:hypothetical protein